MCATPPSKQADSGQTVVLMGRIDSIEPVLMGPPSIVIVVIVIMSCTRTHPVQQHTYWVLYVYYYMQHHQHLVEKRVSASVRADNAWGVISGNP